MPSDTASGRHISAGWLLSEMDKAAARRARNYVFAGDSTNQGRGVTVGIEAMSFKKPVYVGDLLQIFTEVVRQGRSSLTIRAESWTERHDQTVEKVTEGLFTFVAIDKNHKPVEIQTNRYAGNPILVPQGTARKTGATITPAATPSGTLILKMKPGRKDTNWQGDIFGGWLLAKMDKGSSKLAAQYTGHRVASVGVEAMTFHKPVHVRDEIGVYARVDRTGTTSVGIHVEIWAKRHDSGAHEKVTEGLFSYVALDRKFKPVAFGGP